MAQVDIVTVGSKSELLRLLNGRKLYVFTKRDSTLMSVTVTVAALLRSPSFRFPIRIDTSYGLCFLAADIS